MVDICDVVVLGCEHFVSWDGTNERPDILSPRLQGELDDLVSRLADFRPSKVAVEMLPSRQGELDQLIDSWPAVSASGHRSEVSQVGVRLADRVGAAAHAIDADWMLRWDPVEQFLDEHPSQRPGEGVSGEGRLLLQRLAAMPAELPLHVFLRELNRDPSAMLNDREYLDTWLTVGAGDNWGGVDLVASWYRRNLRIFANLRQVVTPGDRVVVVFGVGHAWSLRHFIDTSRAFRLVPVDEVLE